MPIETGPPYEYDLEGGEAADGPQLDQDWIDSVIGREDAEPAPQPTDSPPRDDPEPATADAAILPTEEQ